ncbi:oxidoreductase, partial [Salinimicrobium sp. CDJ15-91]|nr:oxidoreductase [Salinimicrobium oceani]
MKKVCGIVWNYTGPKEEAKETFRVIREFKEPILDHTGFMPYPTLQSMFDGLYPKGLQWFWKADFVNEIPDEAVKKHLEFAEKLPSMHSTMHLYPINGQASRVNSTDTAWNFRDATWAMV